MVRKIALFVVLAAIVAGCSEGGQQYGDSSQAASETHQGGKHDASAFVSTEDGDAVAGNEDSSPPADVRAQARGASLAVRVAKLDDAEKKVDNAIKDAGGFELTLTSSDLASADASLSIEAKVPVEKLDDVIGQIEGMGTRLSKTIRMQDLTAQLIAERAQIKARQAHEQEVASQSAAHTKESQLKHDHQLLTAMQSKEAATVAQVTFADLSLTLRQGAVAAENEDPNWWGQAYGEASTAAAGGFRVLATCLLWLVFMCPFYLPFVVVGVVVQRVRRKRARTVVA